MRWLDTIYRYECGCGFLKNEKILAERSASKFRILFGMVDSLGRENEESGNQNDHTKHEDDAFNGREFQYIHDAWWDKFWIHER